MDLEEGEHVVCQCGPGLLRLWEEQAWVGLIWQQFGLLRLGVRKLSSEAQPVCVWLGGSHQHVLYQLMREVS